MLSSPQPETSVQLGLPFISENGAVSLLSQNTQYTKNANHVAAKMVNLKT